ncbi:hypothetical protein ACFVFI_09785 [Streptomyces sp. NPDC057705]|uniref:hypothetical protein n=1 Tax=Streptomyces sp. NPDC057705 TaxID=3346222 RepID=UPI00368F4BDB
MIGVGAEGSCLCAACCGRDDPAARCTVCRNPGDLTDNGKCPRCRLTGSVRDLLTPAGAPMPDELTPLATVLCEAANPYPVLAWLRRSRAAKTLAHLAEQPEPLTHQLLDKLPQNASTHHVRGLLVTAGILPRRDEHLARLQLWIHHHLPGMPSHQAALIRPFAEWHVLRDARHRSARGHYTLAASKTDIREIRTAIHFLTWLDQQQLTATTTRQADLDLWITRHPAKRRPLASFIRWLRARRINTGLDLRPEQRAFAATFLTEDDYTRHLHRCLADETLPRDVRILGALTLLYALPVSRITELTTDRYHRDDTGAYLTLGRHPVLLPPRLAQLIEAQMHQPASGYFRALINDGTHYLLPGQAPTRSRNSLGATALLRRHGIPVLAGRNTALLEAVTQLPPIIVADLFGLHPQTATIWARHANDSWTHYLAARQ